MPHQPTLIFDFDGTLADSLQATIASYNDVASNFNLPTIDPADAQQLKNLSAKQLITKYKLSPLKLARLLKAAQSQFPKYINQILPFTDLKPMLEDLTRQQIKLGILSSNSQANIDLFLKKHDLNQYFNFAHCERNLFGKAAVLKKIIKQQKLDSNQVLYVGDEVRDVEAAHKAGLKVIAVAWGFNSADTLQSTKPDYLVKEPKEILKIISVNFPG